MTTDGRHSHGGGFELLPLIALIVIFAIVGPIVTTAIHAIVEIVKLIIFGALGVAGVAGVVAIVALTHRNTTLPAFMRAKPTKQVHTVCPHCNPAIGGDTHGNTSNRALDSVAYRWQQETPEGDDEGRQAWQEGRYRDDSQREGQAASHIRTTQEGRRNRRTRTWGQVQGSPTGDAGPDNGV